MDFAEFGFCRIATVQPPLRLADPAGNATILQNWAERAAKKGAGSVIFPELSMTGYTCEDLFQSEALLDDTRQALATLAKGTSKLPITLVVGAPYRTRDGRLFDCALVIHRGAVRGAVPKIHLPNFGEFYERRWFVSGQDVDLEISDDRLGAFRLSARQLFQIGPMALAVEICEDLWAPIPPSCEHALSGANVIVNLSASNELVAKAEYRRELVKQQSARLTAGYVYVSCGPLESTKDIVFGGHALIVENGAILAEGSRFSLEGSMLLADLDLEKINHDRARNTTFADAVERRMYVQHVLGTTPLKTLERRFAQTPFVPDDPVTVSERAREILNIQSTGLARRMLASHSETAVIGVSGGCDSTLATLVAVESMRTLGRPPSKILAVSMPGFGTTSRTRTSAEALASCLGLTFRETSIANAVRQHFKDIRHDPKKYDIVFQNSQARERTQILFDLANEHRGIVVGTGDMSELALGWCTYNGDHMAGYVVNVSVPKTLVQHLVRWYANHVADEPTRKVLETILATPISPELLPTNQETEKLIGPYVLHDFFLFHHLRNGFRPKKIATLAMRAFAKQYSKAEIKKWLKEFLRRFYQQQFKRTCLPPGPKIGSVSLSPRGDLRMPDEVDPAALVREVDAF